jgi:hypothetical protein
MSVSPSLQNCVINYNNGIKHLYSNSNGGKKNVAQQKAYQSFYMSAYEGYALAFKELAMFFYRGISVKQNFVIASLLFIKANELDPTLCIINMCDLEAYMNDTFYYARSIYNWIDILPVIYPRDKAKKKAKKHDFSNYIKMLVLFNQSRGIKVNDNPISDYPHATLEQVLTLKPQLVHPYMMAQRIPTSNPLRYGDDEEYEDDYWEEEVGDDKYSHGEAFQQHQELVKETDDKLEEKEEKEEKVEEDDDDSCTICLDSTLKTSCKQLECNHKFHASCILDWLSKSKTCPMCRKVVSG